MHRRSFILSAAGGLLPLAGCDSQPPHYTAIDITGAAYGPDFHLEGPAGRRYSLADFRGQYVMLFFGFTQCPDVCPTALSRAVEIRRKLGADGARVKVVFVSVDPERDTPALLAEYMAAFDPDFLGLHGDLAQTARAAADFKIFYKKVPSGSSYTMDHTAITYVFDDKGKIRLAMKHEETADECAADLRSLMYSRSSSILNFFKG
ncbi:SCO family protein [Janthinobacterium agaricidamnosum]|uniref:AhpC/TSA family protein n=1 Tax=Janthinobacterium agaricidamnosum NBRC 102515 = DSM 9628 TaxID=1349767 RepID=W0V8P0_9BURK|nr:SCO family protein [Janthinobacterium agaricidamnosum]CDG83642.1 ahpC/TSA family protein [Janthinobacterium agaricidamnosum NBRC 102515 = DSM 9628]